MEGSSEGRWVDVREVRRIGYYWFRWDPGDAFPQPIHVQSELSGRFVVFLGTEQPERLRDCVGQVWSIALEQPPREGQHDF